MKECILSTLWAVGYLTAFILDLHLDKDFWTWMWLVGALFFWSWSTIKWYQYYKKLEP